MGLFRSIRGSISVEITSSDIPRILGEMGEQDIAVLSAFRTGELSARIRIPADELPRLVRLCKRRGDEIRPIKRQGIYWAAKAVGARPLLWCGLLLLLLIYSFLPTRILFVEVEGNERIPKQQILESARECGVAFWAKRSEIRSERVKNALLQAIPELQWTGVNTAGCVATISVREKAETEELPQTGISSIVAIRDGVILSGTVTGGNGLFRVGQAVTKGQILISGYTDLGLTIRAERAGGEIYAQTRHELRSVMPLFCRKKGDVTGTHISFGLIFGKNRINLWKGSGICAVTCDRIYQEYPVTLPGGFCLPVRFYREIIRERETIDENLPEAFVRQELAEFARSYVMNTTIAGQIREQHHAVEIQNGVCGLHSEFVCVEMIGREFEEMMGE